eukprot:SAG22_NODE_601_length_8666_cov_7.089413_5_plen_669_part_00
MLRAALAACSCAAAAAAAAGVGAHLPAPAGGWKWTRCGSPASPGTDIITKWGAAVTALNAKTIFDYPRPQLVRPPDSWHSLNGLWEFEPCPGTGCGPPPFNRRLNQTILVPFPVESCLSGLRNSSNKADDVPPTYSHMFYRTHIDPQAAGLGAGGSAAAALLHFGAVDWAYDVYVNTVWVGSHEGGYDGFTVDITSALGKSNAVAEVVLQVHDPSNKGPQPFGEQRVEAMYSPGGDTYSPVSGVWQPVWLEAVPVKHIQALVLQPSMTALDITVKTSSPDGGAVDVTVFDGANAVAHATGLANIPFSVAVPQPRLWSPESPFLYNLTVSYHTDTVGSYFGMREIGLCAVGGVQRPCINGEYRFLPGFLDQSYFPDGLYTAPGTEAMLYDVQVLRDYGLNFIRLHQKTNPERWYYEADRLGIVVAQDMVQVYGYPWIQGHINQNQSTAQPRYYWHDLKALIDGRGNHPCIIQWTLFNEADMVAKFDPAAVVGWARDYDPSRLLDTNSGGPANSLGIGDVNDTHDYPWPLGPAAKRPGPVPSATQYAMLGEMGGMGSFTTGHMWAPAPPGPAPPPGSKAAAGNRGCFSYGHSFVSTPADEAEVYRWIVGNISRHPEVSVSVYTQTADVEDECDGFLNYDRTKKMGAADEAMLKQLNLALIGKPKKGGAGL